MQELDDTTAQAGPGRITGFGQTVGAGAFCLWRTFITPAARQHDVAAVVDTPMSRAARSNGTPRHTRSNNSHRVDLGSG